MRIESFIDDILLFLYFQILIIVGREGLNELEDTQSCMSKMQLLILEISEMGSVILQ